MQSKQIGSFDLPKESKSPLERRVKEINWERGTRKCTTDVAYVQVKMFSPDKDT